jgi:predicted dehydrogenase
MRLGLVGYGAGGRLFHAPYIDAANDVELVGVVTTSEQRRTQLAHDRPGMAVYDSLADLIAAGVDAVTITTPPQTRRELVLEALAAGIHVVADKPFAPNAIAAQELVNAGRAANRLLAVFHNRRWDADVRTVRALMDSGRLGELWRVESRFELDEPQSLDAGPDGGLLRDLGSHLVDQMIWLLGPVLSVYAELDEIDMPAGRTDAGFAISLRHASGVRSRAAAGKLNRVVEKSWRVYGSAGSYCAAGTDVQTQAILAGRRPTHDGPVWGYDHESRWGILHTADGPQPVASERGAYQDFYTAFAAAARGDGPLPVTAEEGVAVLAVLDAARISAAQGRVVSL